MRNLKKLFALTLVVAMILSTATVAFAASYSKADSANYYAGVTIADTSVAVGDTVAVGLQVYDNRGNDLTVNGAVILRLEYNKTYFEYVDNSGATGWNISKLQDGVVMATKADGTEFTFPADKSAFATVNLKAIAEGSGKIGIDGQNGTSNVANSSIYEEPYTEDGEMYALAPITVTVEAAGPTSETINATVSETPIVDKAGNTWTFTDAKAFLISATGFTKTSASSMSCALTLEAGKVENITIPGTFVNPSVSFQALVHKIPEGKTLSPTATITVE